MTARTGSGTTLAAITNRARGFWTYYRRYTNTAIHAAATAALTAFGLLIFIDPSFAWLAIASYLLPPVVLYALGSDVGSDRSADVEPTDGPVRTRDDRTTIVDGGPDSDAGSGRTDTDGDADHDGPDADADGTDVDRDGSDADSDGSDGDADGRDLDYDGPDLDHDGPDRDADGPDSDSDSDGPDADADGADVDRDGPDLDRDG